MIRLGTLAASPGDQITLQTTTAGAVTTYFGVLEVFDPRGRANEDQWLPSELEANGGTATVRAQVSGYNVIIVPEIASGGSIDATLTVAGQTRTEKLTQSRSAGWSIFVF